MRTHLIAFLIVAPLAVVGCKKKAEPEAAPVAAAPAPIPDVEWKWGPATFAGEKGGETAGKLTIPGVAKNNTDKALVITSYDIGVKGEEGRVCVSRSADEAKSSDGQLDFVVKADCLFSKLPAGTELKLNGTLTYTLGGAETTVDVKDKVAFQP